ncbi:hypothetical protein K456DRAFT_1732211 [Colletotrichum gloeosporioides 23]|nr:hypothetical protein K456DRAFT_1732211 [Colletotrichum gloeosporioides 23]
MPSHFYTSTSTNIYILAEFIYAIFKFACFDLSPPDSLNISKLGIWAYFDLLMLPSPGGINLCL